MPPTTRDLQIVEVRSEEGDRKGEPSLLSKQVSGIESVNEELGKVVGIGEDFYRASVSGI